MARGDGFGGGFGAASIGVGDYASIGVGDYASIGVGDFAGRFDVARVGAEARELALSKRERAFARDGVLLGDARGGAVGGRGDGDQLAPRRFATRRSRGRNRRARRSIARGFGAG